MICEQAQALLWTQEVCQSQPKVLRAGEHHRGGLTKAAMAAPSLEVTAAKDTTRKMMMALTQRRKSWGEPQAMGSWGVSLPEKLVSFPCLVFRD